MTTVETSGLAGQSRSNFANRLKTDFMEKWEDHVHKKTIIADKIAKKIGTMGGKESLGSVATALPQSAGIAAFEGDTLPTATAGSYFQPTVHARDLYTRLRWTGQVRRAARAGNKHAWTMPVKEDTMAADAQFRINFARMLYLGRYQILATVTSFNDESPETGQSVATLFGRDARTSGASDFYKFGAHYLRVNQEVDYLASSVTGNPVVLNDSSANARMKIIAIDTSTPSAPTITLDADPNADYGVTDPVSGSLIIPWGSRKASVEDTTHSAYWAGVSGILEYATDSNTYASVYDLDRGSSYPTLDGVHNKNSGTVRPFDENLISLVVDQVVDNGVGDEPDALVMHRSVRREYVKQTQGDRRFAPVTKEQGFSGRLVFSAGDAELPIVTDRDCPPGLAFVLNTEDWGWLSQSPMGDIDEKGMRFVADKDAHEMIVHKSGNEICRKPFNQGVIDDIQYDVDALVA